MTIDSFPSQPKFSPQDEEVLRRLGTNWKLTPATLAYKLSRGRWIPAPWLLYVSTIIAQAIAQGNGRIIISAPPRHGKSRLIDVWTPIWVMEVFRIYNVVLCSYGADLSEGFGRDVRDLIIENKDDLTCRIRRDSRRVDDFLTEDGGGMMSRGLGGAITGRGAHVLLIDDYIKEIKEALSQVYRDYIWNWFTTTAYTRLEPGGTCIIIATRWHSDDLIGRILKAYPGQWTNIVLPAIAEQDDILGREPGEALFPERYPIKTLLDRHETLGSAFFQALFQQRPLDESLKLSDSSWLRIVDIRQSGERVKRVRSWDFAASEGSGDFAVGVLASYDKMTGIFCIEDVQRGQFGPKDLEATILSTAITDGPEVPILLPKEPGAAGILLINHYQTTVLPEFKVIDIPQSKKKILVAQPFLAAAEARKVTLYRAAWNSKFTAEFDSFPGEYDDQMDAASQAYTYLSGKKTFSATWGRSSRRAPGKMDVVQAGKKQRAAQFELANVRVSGTRGAIWGSRRKVDPTSTGAN